MKTGLGSQAYTIVEVMIVLAVSAMLLVAALALIGGQSQKTQFTQAINDIRTQMNGIINNVSTGYYANTNNFSCTPLPAGPQIITAGSNNQGANGGCVYIGRAVQFNPGGNLKQFTMYNLVGLQFKGGGYSGSIPASLSEAMPVAIAPSSTGTHLLVPPGQIKLQMSYGLQVVAMHYVDIVTKAPPSTTATLAFISNFGQYDSSGNLASGSKVASLWAINPSSIGAGATSPVMVDSLDDASKYVQADSVTICFLGGTKQYGVMTIGSNGRQLNTKMDVFGSVADASGQCS